jgi:hypothetical protein
MSDQPNVVLIGGPLDGRRVFIPINNAILRCPPSSKMTTGWNEVDRRPAEEYRYVPHTDAGNLRFFLHQSLDDRYMYTYLWERCASKALIDYEQRRPR